eukprot:5287640-Pyramimonas_sp.AAC.1
MSQAKQSPFILRLSAALRPSIGMSQVKQCFHHSAAVRCTPTDHADATRTQQTAPATHAPAEQLYVSGETISHHPAAVSCTLPEDQH